MTAGREALCEGNTTNHNLVDATDGCRQIDLTDVIARVGTR
jgi:hypothetical protein